MSRTTVLQGSSEKWWNSLTCQYSFICRKCSASFKEEGTLQKHKLTHVKNTVGNLENVDARLLLSKRLLGLKARGSGRTSTKESLYKAKTVEPRRNSPLSSVLTSIKLKKRCSTSNFHEIQGISSGSRLKSEKEQAKCFTIIKNLGKACSSKSKKSTSTVLPLADLLKPDSISNSNEQTDKTLLVRISRCDNHPLLTNQRQKRSRENYKDLQVIYPVLDPETTEEWDIVSSSDISNDQQPFKLKIKRRRVSSNSYNNAHSIPNVCIKAHSSALSINAADNKKCNSELIQPRTFSTAEVTNLTHHHIISVPLSEQDPYILNSPTALELPFSALVKYSNDISANSTWDFHSSPTSNGTLEATSPKEQANTRNEAFTESTNKHSKRYSKMSSTVVDVNKRHRTHRDNQHDSKYEKRKNRHRREHSGKKRSGVRTKNRSSDVKPAESQCSVCGGLCEFQRSKMHYFNGPSNGDVSKPFGCLTCGKFFSESELAQHDLQCFEKELMQLCSYLGDNEALNVSKNEVVDDKIDFCGITERRIGDREIFKKRRNLICPNCFDYIAKQSPGPDL